MTNKIKEKDSAYAFKLEDMYICETPDKKKHSEATIQRLNAWNQSLNRHTEVNK